MKRYLGPAVLPFNYTKRKFRDRIKPWSEHLANKGFDQARKGLGRTDPAFNKALIPLTLGEGARFNMPETKRGCDTR